MLNTINISLPEKLTHQIDQVIESKGYASRSEFIRTLLRYYFQTINEQSAYELEPFKKIKTSVVKDKMRDTQKYNDKFIQSVVLGLEKSSIYKNE